MGRPLRWLAPGRLAEKNVALSEQHGADLSDESLDHIEGISRFLGSSETCTCADMLGSLKLETNSSGSTTASRDYNAFGSLTSGSNTGLLGFAGSWGYEEDPSGLKLLGHRWYDSFSGRFLTRDPAQDGKNWYGYGANEPTSRIDPRGLSDITVLGNDEDVPLSGLGFFLDRPSDDVWFHPTKKRLITALVAADRGDNFYFWGHGGARGSLFINGSDEDRLTLADIKRIAALRLKYHRGKLGHVELHSCFSARTPEIINAWLDAADELEGYPGVTGSGAIIYWPKTFTRHEPVPKRTKSNPGPPETLGGKKKFT